MMQVFCARRRYVLHWWDEKSNGVTTRPRLLAVLDFTFISWSSYQCYFTLRSTPLWVLDLLGLLCWMLSVLRQDLLCLGWVWIRNSGVSASWVLELQVCATMTSFWTVGLGITGVFDDSSFSPLKPLMLEDSPLAFGKSRPQCRENQQMKCMCNLTFLHSSNVAQSRNLPWEV